jgi:hypothetical protein
LDLRFAESKSLVDATTGQSLVTFTRASSGTYVGSDGLIKTATTNEARFDHHPTTGESLGLLVEEQRTNVVTYSEQFDNAAWSKSNASITANSIAAPTGSVTAGKLIPAASYSAAGNLAQQYFGSNFSTGNVVTFSCFAKAAELNLFSLRTYNEAAGGSRAALFNLSTGTIVDTKSQGGTKTATYSISPAGNGWYRLTLTRELEAAPYYAIVQAASSSAPDYSFFANGSLVGTGNGTSGVHVWGAQLEAGAFPTSYIPTTTATVTRSADVASITGTNFLSFYNTTNGSVFALLSEPHAQSVGNRGAVTFSASNSVPCIGVIPRDPDIQVACRGAGGGSVSTLFPPRAVPVVAGALNKIAFAYSVNSANKGVVENAALNASLTAGPAAESQNTMTGINTLNIGRQIISGDVTGPAIHLRRLTYWPTCLSGTALQTLTQ